MKTRSNRVATVAFGLLLSASGCKSTGGASPEPEPPAPPPDTTPSAEPATAPSAERPLDGGTAAMPETTKPDANAFTLALYAATPKKGNVLLSGTSVRDALGAAYLGARGDTATQMQSALRLAATPEASAEEAKRETEEWKAARGSAQLDVANGLFVDQKVKLEPDFAARAERGYGAKVTAVSFSTSPEPARKTVNTWVSEKTKTKIPELLPPGSVTPLTRLVVANAVYFKGAWAKPFPKARTAKEPFWANGTTSKPLPTMHVSAPARIAKAHGATALELPYAKSDSAMVILLPEAKDGLGKLEGELSPAALADFTKALSGATVDVSLPKFTFKSGGSIKPELQSLGMKAPFSDGADFTAASDVKDLYVSDVFHKTFIAVDEEGTEAAAATGAVMATRGMPMANPVFKADHPFVFFIRDVKHDRILFVGRVVDPS